MLSNALENPLSRRGFLRFGAVGVGLPQLLALRAAGLDTTRVGKARSCIVLFAWGGMSHLDTWDPKPDGPREIRGEFRPLATSVPGVVFTEYMPLLAKQAHRLTVVRSVRHEASDHREAAYWNLTGHRPRLLGRQPILPSREDWPAIGSQVARALFVAPTSDDRPVREIGAASDAPGVRGVEGIGGVEPPPAAKSRPPRRHEPRIVASVSLSGDVLGPGRFATGSFDHPDGYSNHGTVELIGMISSASQSRCALTRAEEGPCGDFSGLVAGDSTAGDWGSDTHGRGGHLHLPGAAEKNEPHTGFGCHANKFITFDLDAVREKHFGAGDGAFRVTGRVGINGAPGVPGTAVGQAAVLVDGDIVDVSEPFGRDDSPHEIEVFVAEKSRYLSLAMLNGVESTHYDDIAFRDVELALVTGDVAVTPPIERELTEELEPTEVRRGMAAALPRTVTLPYPIADRGLLNGQYGGFLGGEFDPTFVRPKRSRPYKGVSASSGHVDLGPGPGVTSSRLVSRRNLLARLESGHGRGFEVDETLPVEVYRERALDMMMAPDVQDAFDLRREPRTLREAYGMHICGQSTLLARRLTEAGVPLVTVYCSSGDLNSGQGDHWDTHGSNFPRLKSDLLPPLARAGSALLDDLAARCRLDETLVVFLTEFGRTPKINPGAGHDHYPSCYSVAFAGGGVQGGGVYGRSDESGSSPVELACGPEDLHATVFEALGIDPGFTIFDLDGRPLRLTEGEPLPIL